VLLDEQGRHTGRIALAEVCALASAEDGLWAGGLGQGVQQHWAAQRTEPHPFSRALQGARLDNHWALA
jgi:hypothetical protein